jgi:hypothetical protein
MAELPADARLTIEQTLRLGALNLAAAVHKDEIRFVRNEDNRPDIAGLILASADRFHTWLTQGEVA